MFMYFNRRDYSALPQSLDKAYHSLYPGPEGDLGSLKVNKSRRFRTSTIVLGTTTSLLLAIVTIQTVYLFRRCQLSFSKSKIISDQQGFSADAVPSWI